MNKTKNYLNKVKFIFSKLKNFINLKSVKKIDIPIFLASDDNYAPYLAAAIASILDNTKSNCNFYILDNSIGNINKEKILDLKNEFKNFSIEFIKVDYKKEFSSIKYKNHAEHITIATYNRFLIPKLKPDFKKVLYLDADVIAFGDIKSLYEIDLEGYSLAAVEESFLPPAVKNEIKDRLKLNPEHKYFNAGVLLFDVQKWLKDDILSSVLKLENSCRDSLKYADQDILNIIFNNNLKLISENYNFMSQFEKDNKKIILRHFNTNIKPWDLNPKKRHALKNVKIFWKYAKKTKFRNELYSKFS